MVHGKDGGAFSRRDHLFAAACSKDGSSSLYHIERDLQSVAGTGILHR
jgi:hypothetical protein